MKVRTEHWWNAINREKLKQQKKSPRATLCTTNLIWVKDGNLRNQNLKIHSVPHCKHHVSVTKTARFNLYRVIIVLFSCDKHKTLI